MVLEVVVWDAGSYNSADVPKAPNLPWLLWCQVLTTGMQVVSLPSRPPFESSVHVVISAAL